MLNNPVLAMRRQANGSMPTPQKWGALAFFLLPVILIAARLIYLVGDLRSTFGALGYSLADFLYGPLSAVVLMLAILALRQFLDKQSPQWMSLAFLTALLAAAAMICVALIRASNRHYHLTHPELALEESVEILVVWTTLIAGIESTGWHFLGWSLLLVGAAGWGSQVMPHLLSFLYWVSGVAALFVYLQSEMEGLAMMLILFLSLWQGILLWRAETNAQNE